MTDNRKTPRIMYRANLHPYTLYVTNDVPTRSAVVTIYSGKDQVASLVVRDWLWDAEMAARAVESYGPVETVVDWAAFVQLALDAHIGADESGTVSMLQKEPLPTDQLRSEMPLRLYLKMRA